MMKGRSLFRVLLFAVFLVFVFYQPLSAGWIVKSKTTSGHEISWNEMYIQNNVFKMIEEDHMFILNGITRELTFVNMKVKIFWKGNLDDFKKKIEEFFGKAMGDYSAQMKEAMKSLTPEQRAIMEQYGANNPMLSKMQGKEVRKPKVEIIRTNEVMTIVDRSVRKYIVKSDGRKIEELWLAENMISKKDWNPEIFRELAESMRMGIASTDYEDSEEYWDLQKKGIALKTIHFQGGYQIIDEVEELIEKNLPSSTFSPPSDCKEASLESVLQTME